MTDLSGKTIKGYEIRERIGEGGFGAVYRAHETAVNREVAIKVILPQHANRPEFIRGFETEAQTVARLEHPHIVPLYTYWRDTDGAYLVMRYLREGSLCKLLEKGALELEPIARMLDNITSALAFRPSFAKLDTATTVSADASACMASAGLARSKSGSRSHKR